MDRSWSLQESSGLEPHCFDYIRSLSIEIEEFFNILRAKNMGDGF